MLLLLATDRNVTCMYSAVQYVTYGNFIMSRLHDVLFSICESGHGALEIQLNIRSIPFHVQRLPPNSAQRWHFDSAQNVDVMLTNQLFMVSS